MGVAKDQEGCDSPCSQEPTVWSSHGSKGQGCVREGNRYSVMDSAEGDGTPV